MKILTLTALVLVFTIGAANAITKIAHIGDSITYGYDPNDATSTGYCQKLNTLLGANYQDENDGVSSTTVTRKGSYPYWTKGKLSNVFAGKPNIITIMLGTNDSRPNFYDAAAYKKDYLALIDTLNTISTKPKIYVVFPPPAFRSATDRPSDANVQAEITILTQIAKDRSLTTIDAHTPLVNFSKYFTDGIHPNQAGYDSLAHAYYRVLKTTAIDNVVNKTVVPQTESKTLRMVFQPGFSITILGKNMVPGALYSAKIFDAKGALCAQAVVGNNLELKAFGQTLRGKAIGLRLLELSRVTQ